ncbi:MAG: FAD-binding oxidoreductase [Candidatus Peregrinibacteria bacterium]
MPLPTFLTHCTSYREIARDVIEFTLTKPEGFTFKAGQFVMFQVPLKDKPEDLQGRAYSIASSPDESELLFLIKLKEGGRASRWVRDDLHVGSEVTMQGPLGNFILKEGDHDLLFIGTSTGVVPFRSQILSALSKGEARRIDLVYGVRSEEDVFWQEEFTKIAKQHPDFHAHIALSQPSPSWAGLTGRVQIVTPSAVPDVAGRSVYVCGNPAMVEEVKTAALGPWGVAKERLHVEGYV